jgi:hypothetical protein
MNVCSCRVLPSRCYRGDINCGLAISFVCLFLFLCSRQGSSSLPMSFPLLKVLVLEVAKIMHGGVAV